MKEILLVALGAALSFLATTIAEKQKHRKNKIEEEKTYILRVKLGLQSLNAALLKLKEGYSYRNFFEFLRINALDNEIANLQFIKSNIDKLSQNKQEKLLILFSDIDLLVKEMNGLENFAVSSRKEMNEPSSIFKSLQEYESYFERQRTQKLIDLVEAKRRIEDFLRETN